MIPRFLLTSFVDIESQRNPLRPWLHSLLHYHNRNQLCSTQTIRLLWVVLEAKLLLKICLLNGLDWRDQSWDWKNGRIMMDH